MLPGGHQRTGQSPYRLRHVAALRVAASLAALPALVLTSQHHQLGLQWHAAAWVTAGCPQKQHRYSQIHPMGVLAAQASA